MAKAHRCTIMLAAAAGLLLACGSPKEAPASRRIGAPPDLVGMLREAAGAPEAIQFTALEPYERARDLEVLIFSTRSPAFWGVILPGRWLQLQAPWVQRFPAAALSGVREDVAAAVREGPEALAVPITVDGPVLVIREDLWKETGLPPPRSLAALREGVRRLRATRAGLRWPVVSDLPEDLLFWGLAWSFEGAPNPELYTYPKLYALKFMDEFDLSPAPERSHAGAQKLLAGSAAALFTTSSRAARLQEEGANRGGAALWVGPLPGQAERATCIYNGWCVASPRGAADDAALRAWLLSPALQARLAAAGYLPAKGESPAVPAGTAAWAMGMTRLCAPPALDDRAREAVRGAILDATEGPMTPEEALRRAQARLQSEVHP